MCHHGCNACDESGYQCCYSWSDCADCQKDNIKSNKQISANLKKDLISFDNYDISSDLFISLIHTYTKNYCFDKICRSINLSNDSTISDLKDDLISFDNDGIDYYRISLIIDTIKSDIDDLDRDTDRIQKNLDKTNKSNLLFAIRNYRK